MFNLSLEIIWGHTLNNALSLIPNSPSYLSIQSWLSFMARPVHLRQRRVSSRSGVAYELGFLHACQSCRMPTLKTAGSLKALRRFRDQAKVLHQAGKRPASPLDRLFKQWRGIPIEKLLLSGWRMSLVSVMTCVRQSKTLKVYCKRSKKRINLSKLLLFS